MSLGTQEQKQVIIIGAGPAGLTAGYRFTEYGIKPLIIEQLDRVGGISRTDNYKGYYFDMGGHRFFSKSKTVNQFWDEILGSELITRARLSRILYNSHYFNYPLKLGNTLLEMGLREGIQIILSYLKAKIKPYKDELTFEHWVTNRFGKYLFEIFFKSYTEKVWGIPTSELRAEFAAQRIKDLSLTNALMSMFIKPKSTIVTLIEEFKYPRFGPGMLWERVQGEIEARQGKVLLNTTVNKIFHDGKRITAIEISNNGKSEVIEGTDFVSSMSLMELIQKMDDVPTEIQQAAQNLHYRDFITVCLIINRKDLFPDNWIYIHSPGVKVGRIQNFKNWSPEMVPDPNMTSLGMEYFCNKDDSFWCLPDDELIELGKRELSEIGLATYSEIEDGCVFRVEKAYPIYDADYRSHLENIRGYLDQFINFNTIGRNGLHQYNNQDHSMVTGMIAVRNVMLGEQNCLWEINGDHHYHEEKQYTEHDEVDLLEILKRDLEKAFPRLDSIALGLSFGIILGLLFCISTLILVFQRNMELVINLQLLSNFMPGYAVSPLGSVFGLLYGMLYGFVIGWGYAFVRNICVYFTALLLDKQIRMSVFRQLLDEI